jgi:hypothetical protein
MNGFTVYDLNVFVKPSDYNLSVIGYALWSKKGAYGNKWLRAEVRHKYLNTPYRLVLEGLTSSSSFSMIAVDDVRLLDKCPPHKTGDRFCDFESDDLCGYSLDTLDSVFVWKRVKAYDLNKLKIGPTVDQYDDAFFKY